MSSRCSVGANDLKGAEAFKCSACGRRLCSSPRTLTRLVKRFRSLFFAILLLLLATAEGQSSSNGCVWQHWHPSTLPSIPSQEGTSFHPPPLLCAPGAFVTSFFADVIREEADTWMVGTTSAQCSDGTFLGFYNADKTASMPQNQVLNDPSGISSVQGSANTYLQSVGTVVDPSTMWQDSCPTGMHIIGYQAIGVTNASSMYIVEQIRFVCANQTSQCAANSPTSSSVAALPQAMRTAASSDTSQSLSSKGPAPAPAPSSMQYMLLSVQFTVNKGTADSVSPLAVEQSLRDLEGDALSTIIFVRRNGCSYGSDQGSNVYVGCFEAGPLPGNLALYLIDDLTGQFESGQFNAQLMEYGINASDSKFLFAGITSKQSHAWVPAPGPWPMISSHMTPTANSGNSSSKAWTAGEIAGVVAAVVVAVLILLTAALCFVRHRKLAQRMPSVSMDKPFASPSASPGLTPDHSGQIGGVLREDSSIEYIPQPVRLHTPPPPIISWMVPTAVQSAPSPVAVRSMPSAGMQSLGMQAVSTWTSPFKLAAASHKDAQGELPGAARHHTQDSDEVMDSWQGGTFWKVMRADVQDEDREYEPQPSAKPMLEQARDLQTWSSAFPDSTDGWHISLEDLAICRDKSGRGIQLGGGASGKVYKAILNEVEEVAVKCLEGSSAAQQALFLREIEIHRRCRSAHVVQFLGACVQPSCVMLVTELMHQSLYSLIHDERKTFSWEGQGRAVALDVAQALAYLHKQRVVHLDVKSSNVLLTREGAAKVADVGLSQVLQNTYLSQVDGAGTFAYASPELLSGGSNCSTKADIWSFGVLLHEMVTRELPKRGKLSDITSPEQCPEYIADLIWQCIQREPEQRPSAKAIVKVLQTAKSSEEARIILAEEVDTSSYRGSLGRQRLFNFSEVCVAQRSASMPMSRPLLERHSVI